LGLRTGQSAYRRSRQEALQPSDVYEGGGDGRRQILVAVDGTEASLRAAAYAVGAAGRRGVKLVVLYVHTSGPLATTPEIINAMRVGNAQALLALRREMQHQASAFPVDIMLVERHGSPYAEIVRLAAQLHVDGVIVAAGAQFGYRLKASPAVRLVRGAQWPVTVVP
jgi:nucleotide-binding universal stress UspA family protein